MKRIGLVNKCNVYTALWCIYYLQGTLYPVGGTISRLSLVVLILWSLFYLLDFIKSSYKPAYLKGMLGMMILYFIYWVFIFLGARHGVGGDNDNTLVLKNLCISTLPLFAYIHFSKQGELSDKRLLIWLPIFLLVAISSYYYEQTSRLEMILEMGGKRDEVVNNSGYLFVALIPYGLLFKKKPLLEVLLIIVCLIFVVTSVKRGAILVAALSILLYAMFRLKNSRKSSRVLTLFLIVATAIVAISYFDSFVEQSDLFSARMDSTREGDSSGRSEMWLNLLHHFVYDNSFLEMLFGSGFGSATVIAGDAAHNDWLQILTEMGLVGIAFYIIYWLSFFKTWRRIKRTDELLYAVVSIIFVAEFFKTFFSFSFNATPFYELPLLGYCIACLYRGRETISRNYRISTQ